MAVLGSPVHNSPYDLRGRQATLEEEEEEENNYYWLRRRRRLLLADVDPQGGAEDRSGSEGEEVGGGRGG